MSYEKTIPLVLHIRTQTKTSQKNMQNINNENMIHIWCHEI